MACKQRVMAFFAEIGQAAELFPAERWRLVIGDEQCVWVFGLTGQRCSHLPAAYRFCLLVEVTRDRAIIVRLVQGRRLVMALRHDEGTPVCELAALNVRSRCKR